MHPPSILVIIGIITSVGAVLNCKPSEWFERTTPQHLDMLYNNSDSEFQTAIQYYKSIRSDDYDSCDAYEGIGQEEQAKYKLTDKDVPSELSGGVVVCQKNGPPVDREDVKTAQRAQLKACNGSHWGKNFGPERLSFPSGNLEAFQCDYTKKDKKHHGKPVGQTCHPESLVAMLLQVHIHCGTQSGYFYMRKWDVAYGRVRKEYRGLCE
ncbi:hypothetical protein EJ05DRAFT_500587 [Pseudovirgaria hyperparasitica]|uniref:Uncharacterized protein n=1 Tax=Pseudovirgaria hyperparasitica TaxID=470096 RepID=A0A6A6W5B8_9PEZI|nr:uncharacterized protein EJ05DRAFT_500587 [Pseudovirgaria hyperparasitica]KAF2758072.1 hypothetical protein EJ05DRAFT_500587 [Pseudovirgaria hyperparasitica]